MEKPQVDRHAQDNILLHEDIYRDRDMYIGFRFM